MSTQNPNNHHLSTEIMSLALDGLLDSREESGFQQHLQVCPLCRGQWLRWQRISFLLEAEPFVGPAPGFALRVDQKIWAERQRRERLLGGLVVLGSTFSVWILLLMGILLSAVLWAFVTPDAPLILTQALAAVGQLASLALNNLFGLRNAVFGVAPFPALLLLAGAALFFAAILWIRLVPIGAVRRQTR